MTTATLVTNDSVGNSAITPIVYQTTSPATRQVLAVTINGTGPGPFMVIVQFSGSADGQNWVPIPTLDVSGGNGATNSKSVTRPFQFWTCAAVFNTPNTTYTATITY